MIKTDVLIIGCGIAGTVAALELAEKGREVVLIGARDEKTSNSAHAQGGICFSGGGDSPNLFYQDIVQAGAGLCYPPAVEQLVNLGPRMVQEILIDKFQVPFERSRDGNLLCT